MQNSPARKKPPYVLGSVDNALRLIQLLRDTGGLRLGDAATELGVAPSTAHRLMSMLVYRDFASQDEARNYLPGPAIGLTPVTHRWTRVLRDIATPYVESLSNDLNETTNLVIRVGSMVRFLVTVEGSRVLRVGDRRGVALPVHQASGGKALLAEAPAELLARLFRGQAAELAGIALDDDELRLLERDLQAVRTTGYATNINGTESGVSAISVAVHDAERVAVAAMTVAIPSTRFEEAVTDRAKATVFAARDALESELVALQFRVNAS